MKIIIKESQYKRVLLKEYYPGTKKPMGSDGVDETIFKEILFLMKTMFVKEAGFQQVSAEVESKGKITTKQQKNTIGQALGLIDKKCKETNRQFNNQKISNFCTQINEILYSDSDNIFSYSYS